MVETETEVERARVSQVVDYIFYLIYGLITLEIVLDLLGARESNSFNRCIEALNRPLLSPFRGLLVDPSNGRFQLRLSYLNLTSSSKPSSPIQLEACWLHPSALKCS